MDSQVILVEHPTPAGFRRLGIYHAEPAVAFTSKEMRAGLPPDASFEAWLATRRRTTGNGILTPQEVGRLRLAYCIGADCSHIVHENWSLIGLGCTDAAGLRRALNRAYPRNTTPAAWRGLLALLQALPGSRIILWRT